MTRKLRVFHNSEYGTWLDCHQMWKFAYLDRLDTEDEPFYFRFGTAFHAGTEAVWRAVAGGCGSVDELSDLAVTVAEQSVREVIPGASDEVRAECLEGIDVLRWALPHYLQSIKSDFTRYEPIWIEQPFRAPVLDASGRMRHLFQDGAIDLLLFDKATGSIVMREQKTTADSVLGFESKLAIDTQMTGYLEHAKSQRLERTMVGTPIPDGAPVGRVQYDVVRRKRPGVPSVNKVRKNDGLHTVTAALAAREAETGENQGLVSRAQQDTTYALYEQALGAQVSRGLAVTPEQAERLDSLRDQADTFFVRHEYNRFSEAEVLRWRREVWAETSLMENVRKGTLPATRNVHHCTGPMSRPCKYKLVCQSDTPENRAMYRVRDEDELHGPKRDHAAGSEGPAAGRVGGADDSGF